MFGFKLAMPSNHNFIISDGYSMFCAISFEGFSAKIQVFSSDAVGAIGGFDSFCFYGGFSACSDSIICIFGICATCLLYTSDAADDPEIV